MSNNNTLQFNDRITYLAWRSEWKVEYKQLSQDIRQVKQDLKEQQRKIIIVRSKWWNEPQIDGKPLSSDFYQLYRRLSDLRARATAMLLLLGEAKEKSKVQRDREIAARLCATVQMPVG